MELDRNKQSLLLEGKRYSKEKIFALCGWEDWQPLSDKEYLENGLSAGDEKGLKESLSAGDEEGLKELLSAGDEKEPKGRRAAGDEKGLKESLSAGGEEGLKESLSAGGEEGLKELLSAGDEKQPKGRRAAGDEKQPKGRRAAGDEKRLKELSAGIPLLGKEGCPTGGVVDDNVNFSKSSNCIHQPPPPSGTPPFQGGESVQRGDSCGNFQSVQRGNSCGNFQSVQRGNSCGNFQFVQRGDSCGNIQSVQRVSPCGNFQSVQRGDSCGNFQSMQHVAPSGCPSSMQHVSPLKKDQCTPVSFPESSSASPFLRELFLFLTDWFNDSPTLEVQTSGSTGTPKRLTVRKEQMIQSARLTCEFLNLKAGDKALLCMPLQYIAGKMVVVRALVAGLDLIVRTPSGHPLAGVDMPLRFAAMVPLQVYNTMQNPQERERICRTDILIIGGGAIDAALETEIRNLPGEVYSTYGMTETLSHIALRRLNGPQASSHYQPFSSVQLSLSVENTLVIDAPLVCDERLVTNDVAELYPDGTFTILGRKDNIINTGGIKVQAEVVEDTLRPFIPVPFAVTSRPDARLGEAVVLLLEKTEALEEIRKQIPTLLTKYQQPKYIHIVESIPLTGTGKIDRAACRTISLR